MSDHRNNVVEADRTKVCFVSLRAAAELLGEASTAPLGGASVQTLHIARALGSTFEVHFVIHELGQGDQSVERAYHLHTTYRPGAGVRFLRFFHPRWTRVWAALKRADADIYYQRAAGALTGLVGAYCKMHQKRFVYAVANDNELLGRWRVGSYRFEGWLFERGVRWADQIVVQNRYQKDALLRKKGLDSVEVNSIYAGPLGREEQAPGYILMVANVQRKKRHDIVLRVAQRFPDLRFRLVGGGSGSYFERIRAQARELTNVEFLGQLSHAATLRQYPGASLLLSTARAEGFPNTFLEAWARGVPVLSLGLDPAGVIRAHELGLVAKDEDQLGTFARQLVSSPALRRGLGENCVRYVRVHHQPQPIARAYSAIFRALVAGDPDEG